MAVVVPVGGYFDCMSILSPQDMSLLVVSSTDMIYLQVVCAVIAIFIIPDVPRTTRWLSEQDRELAAWRLMADIGEDDWVDSQHQSPLRGLKLALTFVTPSAWTQEDAC